MATSAWREMSSGGVAGAGRAVATQRDGGSGTERAMRAIQSNRMRHAAQEVLRAFLLRRAQNGARAALLDDLAAIDEYHSIRHLTCETHLVRDHDHRHAIVREHAHDSEHFADQLG